MSDDAAGDDQTQSSIRILELAVVRGLLTSDQLQTLIDQKHNADLCDVAVQENLIRSSDVDLLKPLAQPTTFLPGYEFLELIGVGAAGAVYKARHEKLGRMVALKLLKPSVMQSDSATARSRMEARIGASLQHPNVVVVHDYGVHRQRIYLAQEFIQGESVLDLIEREGAIDPATALQITQQVASALNHAAAEGVVHRDIKPANLLLAESAAIQDEGNLVVKVTDFGLAFQKIDGDDATRLTVDGATLGTPSYAAPEQLVDSNVDLRADIYSLGATLFHMVTGQQPFQNANAFQAIADKMSGKQRWREVENASMPPGIRSLVMDMTHHEANDRIQTYHVLNERLQQALQQKDETSTTWQEQSTAANRSPARKLIIAILMIIVFGAAAFLMPESKAPVFRAFAQTGTPVYFFQGDGLPNHELSRSTGQFVSVEDEETSPVLAGTNGSMWFNVPQFGDDADLFRFRIEVNVVDAKFADICFALNSDTCHAVRIDADVAYFGTLSVVSKQTVFDPSNSVTIPVSKSEDGPRYQLVSIDRQPAGWFVSVNGELIGSCFPATNELSEVKIQATDGTVHFANIYAIKLAESEGG